jgi:hypothetical protein
MASSTGRQKTSSRGGSPNSKPGQIGPGGSVKRALPPPTPDPPRDPHGHWERLLCDLARKVGRTYDDVLDWWWERASIREWCGNQSRTEADACAYEDAVRHFDPPPPQLSLEAA